MSCLFLFIILRFLFGGIHRWGIQKIMRVSLCTDARCHTSSGS